MLIGSSADVSAQDAITAHDRAAMRMHVERPVVSFGQFDAGVLMAKRQKLKSLIASGMSPASTSASCAA